MLKLLPMLASAASSDLEQYIRRKRRNLIGYCVAALFGFTAYASGVAALVVWLMQTNSPLVTWLVVGVISISLSLLAIAIILGLNYYEKRKRSRTSSTASTAALFAASQAASSKSFTPVMLALAGAYFAWSHNSKSKQENL